MKVSGDYDLPSIWTNKKCSKPSARSCVLAHSTSIVQLFPNIGGHHLDPADPQGLPAKDVQPSKAIPQREIT